MQLKLTTLLTITLSVGSALTAQQAQPRIRFQAPPPQNSASGASRNPNGHVRISGGVMAGQLLTRVDPVYPAEARNGGVEGTVVLHVLVTPEGTVESAIPVSGPETLRQAAADAVSRWTYKPFILNGDPVGVDTTVTVNFKLEPSASPQI